MIEYTIANSTGEAKYVFNTNDVVYTTREFNQTLKSPNVEPRYYLPMGVALNVKKVYKKERSTIDGDGVFQVHEGFDPRIIDLPNLGDGGYKDIYVVSSYYFRIAWKYQRYLPPFFIDRLFIPRKVFDRDPVRARKCGIASHVVGCTLSAGAAPYPPCEYVRGINNFMNVSAASLQRCIQFYSQPEILAQQYLQDGGVEYSISFLKDVLERRLIENRNKPVREFLIPLSGTDEYRFSV